MGRERLQAYTFRRGQQPGQRSQAPQQLPGRKFLAQHAKVQCAVPFGKARALPVYQQGRVKIVRGGQAQCLLQKDLARVEASRSRPRTTSVTPMRASSTTTASW